MAPRRVSLDAPRGVVTCPGGQQTATKARNAHDTGWKFRFAQRQCTGCLLRAPCLTPPAQPHGRSVIKHDYEAEYTAARAQATTPGSTAVRQQHPRVERKLADIVRDHGDRRSRYRGQWRVQIQYLLTGLVVHVKRLVQLRRPQGAHARRHTGAPEPVCVSTRRPLWFL